jgi:hypothetical protein
MDAPPSKGPSVYLPRRADSWAHLRLSMFPASRQLNRAILRNRISLPYVPDVYNLSRCLQRFYRGSRDDGAHTGKQTGAAAALTMSRTADRPTLLTERADAGHRAPATEADPEPVEGRAPPNARRARRIHASPFIFSGRTKRKVVVILFSVRNGRPGRHLFGDAEVG